MNTQSFSRKGSNQLQPYQSLFRKGVCLLFIATAMILCGPFHAKAGASEEVVIVAAGADNLVCGLSAIQGDSRAGKFGSTQCHKYSKWGHWKYRYWSEVATVRDASVNDSRDIEVLPGKRDSGRSRQN